MTLIKLKLFPDLNAGVLDNTHSTHCTLQKFIIVIKFFTHSLGCHKENGSFCLQDTVKYVSSNWLFYLNPILFVFLFLYLVCKFYITQYIRPLLLRAKPLQSCPTLCDPRDCTRQAPPSMGLSRQEHCSGLLRPPPGDLPDPGMELTSLTSPASAGRFFTTSTTFAPCLVNVISWPVASLWVWGIIKWILTSRVKQ